MQYIAATLIIIHNAVSALCDAKAVQSAKMRGRGIFLGAVCSKVGYPKGPDCQNKTWYTFQRLIFLICSLVIVSKSTVCYKRITWKVFWIARCVFCTINFCNSWSIYPPAEYLPRIMPDLQMKDSWRFNVGKLQFLFFTRRFSL